MDETDLRSLLGPEVPPTVAGLPEVQRARLCGQIRAARAHQEDVIRDAVRKAVSGVPFPVRRLVRKALLG